MIDVTERAAAGRAARSVARRSAHSEWAPAANRPDPVAVIEAQDARRVPELVPIRHGRMAASPFAFYRGAAAVMAADLAATPVSGFQVQTCGDAFDRAVCHFAESYADQSERDHAALVAAIDSGRLESVPDV